MHQIAAATSGCMIAKFSGWAMKTVAAAGIAERTPAVVATRGSARASRAIAQVRGAASEPMIASGRADAMGLGPSSVMNGTWTRLASGSQWALDGIGSVAGSGIRLPTSAKIQTKSTFRPCPAAMARATST